MGNPVSRSAGWLKIPNAAAGIEALGLYTKDSAERVPYVFGVGDTDTGRMSTSTRAGAAITFPDAYGFGEAWELRWTYAETGNSQRQGIFMEVRSDVANSSTIRGVEIRARQGAAVAIGGLEGGHFEAMIASSSTGDVTTAIGLTAQVSMDDTYTGTVTTLYGLRAKVQTEDGATAITTGYGVYIENEAVTGIKMLTAAIGIASTSEGIGFGSLIDSRGTGLEVINTNQVRLMAFRDAAGTDKMLVYDPDSATSVSVANYA